MTVASTSLTAQTTIPLNHRAAVNRPAAAAGAYTDTLGPTGVILLGNSTDANGILHTRAVAELAAGLATKSIARCDGAPGTIECNYG